jgi:F-type H+-transporting ATPase subunit a
VTHDRQKSRRFLPICGTLFLFILFSNWLGLIPGVGSIGVWATHHGEAELIPLFRAATADLNMTLAMGIGAVVLSHIVGVGTIGFFKHWSKFIQVAGIWKAIKSFAKDGIGQGLINVFVSLVELAVGFIELISEVAKMISLSLRLFGNIFAGEVLLWVFFSLVAYLVPVPFYFMEMIVGVVQAMIFATLTLVYLTAMTEAPHGEEAGAH